MNVLGLMSGSSADGVDAELAQISGSPIKPKWKLLNLVSISYPTSLSQTVIKAGQGVRLSSCEWLELAEAITEVHAQAASKCDSEGIATVGDAVKFIEDKMRPQLIDRGIPVAT